MVTTSWANKSSVSGIPMRVATYLHRSHNLLDLLVVELKNTVEDTDLVVTQRLLALAVEGEEGLQFGFLVGVGFVVAEDVVKQLGDGPRNRS